MDKNKLDQLMSKRQREADQERQQAHDEKIREIVVTPGQAEAAARSYARNMPGSAGGEETPAPPGVVPTGQPATPPPMAQVTTALAEVVRQLQALAPCDRQKVYDAIPVLVDGVRRNGSNYRDYSRPGGTVLK